MKIFLKIVAALFVLVALSLTAALFLTRGIADTADEFFAAVERNDMGAAYAKLSQGFQSGTSESELARFLDQQKMRSVIATSWSSRQIENQTGSLRGSLTTASDGTIPITIELIKEQDEWRIHRIERPAAGLVATPSLPSDEEARRLAHDTARTFLASVQAGSMQNFHASVSELWQQQYSVESLNESYAAFLNLDADLGPLAAMTPQIIETPQLDENGVLRMATLYPTDLGEFRFGLSYVLEAGQWRALGLNASVN